MQNFQNLAVWQRAHALVLNIYRMSKELPQTENFGLILNLRRSAINMATRIAEGAGKPTDAELDLELKKARAVGYELEYLLLVARDLGFIEATLHDDLADEVVQIRKMLSSFVKRVRPAP